MSAFTTQQARRWLGAAAVAAVAAALLAGAGPAAAQARTPARTAALNAGGNAGVNSVSCPSAGNCSAGGWYAVSPGLHQTFVVSQVHGAWGTAAEVPGIAALNQGGRAATTSVSCAPGGLCTAAGNYNDSAGHQQAFVVSQTSRSR